MHGKSLDGIYIPKGYNLILYSEKNFKGKNIEYNAIVGDIYTTRATTNPNFKKYLNKNKDFRYLDTATYANGSMKIINLNKFGNSNDISITNISNWTDIKNEEYYKDYKGEYVDKSIYANKNGNLLLKDIKTNSSLDYLTLKTPDEVLRYIVHTNYIEILQLNKDKYNLLSNTLINIKIYSTNKYDKIIIPFDTLNINFVVVDERKIGFTDTVNKVMKEKLNKVYNILFNLQKYILVDNIYNNAFDKIKFSINYYNSFSHKKIIIENEIIEKDTILFDVDDLINNINFDLYDVNLADIDVIELLDRDFIYNGIRELDGFYTNINTDNINNYKIPFIYEHNYEKLEPSNIKESEFYTDINNEPNIMFFISNFSNGRYNFPINPSDTITNKCLFYNNYKDTIFNSKLSSELDSLLNVQGFYWFYFMISSDEKWDLKFPYIKDNNLVTYNSNASTLTNSIDKILLKNSKNNIRYYSNNSNMLSLNLSNANEIKLNEELAYFFNKEYLATRIKKYGTVSSHINSNDINSDIVTITTKTNSDGIINNISNNVKIPNDVYKVEVTYNNKVYKIMRGTWDTTKVIQKEDIEKIKPQSPNTGDSPSDKGILGDINL
jgi:hypothetical protein